MQTGGVRNYFKKAGKIKPGSGAGSGMLNYFQAVFCAGSTFPDET